MRLNKLDWEYIERMPKIINRYYEIALNLTDPMFRGVYRGKPRHQADYTAMLSRAAKVGVQHILVTGSSIVESQQAVTLCQEFTTPELPLFYTIGVHPCCVNEFADTGNDEVTIDSAATDIESNVTVWDDTIKNPSFANGKLIELYNMWVKQLTNDRNNFRAIGEIGLDYDRLYYSSKEMQLAFFEEQLKLYCILHDNYMGKLIQMDKPLPFFLHMRAAGDDFYNILYKFINGFTDKEDTFNLSKLHKNQNVVALNYKFPENVKFVVHSFTDDVTCMKKILDLSPNCYIGINGASIRGDENIEAAKFIPIDRILIETDAPWCDIRKSHASYPYLEKSQYKSPFKSLKKEKLDNYKDDKDLAMIKERNEPCNIVQVAQVLSQLKNIDMETLTDTIYKTSCEIYGE